MTKPEAIALMKQGKRVCTSAFPHYSYRIVKRSVVDHDGYGRSIKRFAVYASNTGWQEYKPQEDEN